MKKKQAEPETSRIGRVLRNDVFDNLRRDRKNPTMHTKSRIEAQTIKQLLGRAACSHQSFYGVSDLEAFIVVGTGCKLWRATNHTRKSAYK